MTAVWVIVKDTNPPTVDAVCTEKKVAHRLCRGLNSRAQRYTYYVKKTDLIDTRPRRDGEGT